MVIKTSWDFMDIAVFYIPELLTTNQKRWLDTNLEGFKNYDYVGFNNYSLINDKVKEENIENIDEEIAVLNKRYLNYRKSLGVEGRVIIVQDEEQIEDEIFDELIVGNENHVDKYQDFSDKYHLDYKFNENDSYIAPLTMASLGHFCYNIADSINTILSFVPEVVTKRQYNYFVNNKDKLLNYDNVSFLFIRRIDEDLYKDEFNDLEKIEKEIKKRYDEYKKKREEKNNVR